MARESRIQYNPALTVRENAKHNCVSEAAIRYYIKTNGINRRGDEKKRIIEDCRAYLRKHRKATWNEVQRKTGHSLSTIRKYRALILDEKAPIDFDSEKTKKCQIRGAQAKEKLYAYLDRIPKDEIIEYLAKREEKEQNGTVDEKKRIDEVKILDGIPFKPYEDFYTPVSECIQFHSKALPENKVLSNLYECIITFRGYEFYGVEQLYVALNYSDSPSIVKRIMNCKSGKEAKSLCHKKYADKRDVDFDEKRYRIIALCHLFKYLSVKEFRNRLRETSPQTLVECPNGKDYHYGMVQNLETNVFEGNNCSGRTMMAVRDMMKEKEDYEIGHNEALMGREFYEAEKEEVREALYGDLRYQFENDKQIIKDSKKLFAILEKEGIPNKREPKPKPFEAPKIDKNTKCLVLDFDDTLFDTSADDSYRKGKEKDLDKAMGKIPEYKLYDGWRDVIDWTKKNGVKIAILSSASRRLIKEAIQHFSVPCAAIIGYQPYMEKPNTILGNMLQERLGIRHSQIIYVGNSKSDETQARASQFRFLGATWGSHDTDYFTEKGVQTVNTPKEIIPVLEAAGWESQVQPRTFKNVEEAVDFLGGDMSEFARNLVGVSSVGVTVMVPKDSCKNGSGSFLLGTIAGDMIGKPYERRDRAIKTTDFPLFDKRSKYTDDTVLTIAVMDWLLSDSEHKWETLAERFVHFGTRYRIKGQDRCFSEDTAKWLLDDNRPFGKESKGNGAAMRVAPVGWFFDSVEKVEEVARIQAALTHNSEEAIQGAQIAAVSVLLARQGKTKEAIRAFIEERYGWNLHNDFNEYRNEYEWTSLCGKTVEGALMAFLASSDFEQAVRNAVSLGGDADTIGAITGSIAEAYYGEVPEIIRKEVLRRSIPEEFLDVIGRFSMAVFRDKN